MTGTPTNASPLDATLRSSLAQFVAERPPGADEDVHMLPRIVDHVIERCSQPGDLVFDPFVGFGTTLQRAIALGRRGLGIELLPERVAQIERQTPDAQVLEGDARELARLVRGVLPAQHVDLVLTSPPYMTANDHDTDPLTAYERGGGDYGRYLAELGEVAAQCARLVRPGGYVVWNVADIHHAGHTTDLIDDCARVLAAHLALVDITPIEWDTLPHDLVADALLVYQRTQ